MKISRILSLIIIALLSLTLLVGCRCTPYKEEWHFYSYKQDITFVGGVKLNMGFSDASHAYPFAGVESQNIGISFSKDGKVEFTPKDGKALHGTYTYEHAGRNYTSFTITLENGEIIEGSSIKTLKDTKLALTYQGVIYNFIDKDKRMGITIDDVIRRILDGDKDCLNEATVLKDGDGYAVRFSEMIYYPIKEETAVYAVQIYKDGSYAILDELREGNVLSTYNNGADYIVVYYIEK